MRAKKDVSQQSRTLKIYRTRIRSRLILLMFLAISISGSKYQIKTVKTGSDTKPVEINFETRTDSESAVLGFTNGNSQLQIGADEKGLLLSVDQNETIRFSKDSIQILESRFDYFKY